MEVSKVGRHMAPSSVCVWGVTDGEAGTMSYLWAPSTRKILVSSVISWVTWEEMGR